MIGVLTGFAIIGFIIAVGYGVGRSGIAGPGAQHSLNRVAFFVATPALLFTVLAKADLDVVFSAFLLASASAVAVAAILYLIVARVLFRRPVAETTIGAASASYVNANNIGLPVAIYVLGDAQLVAPVLLLQLLVLAPTTLTILDISSRGSASVVGILTQPLRNPMIIASMLGILIAVTGLQVPDAVYEPFRLIGGAAIPIVLMAFGMSLVGRKPLAPGSGRGEIIVASVIKTVIMPLAAFLLARFAFHLDADQTFAATVIAGLPTAQNIFNFASRYERGVVLARDTVLITTVASIPVLLVIAALLAPGT
ncbi:AEC family transporter [Clavibacter michiganensis]|uniref:Putative transporter YfdV n=1 Tax=Clavibacter michiganensis TaxID=28447 RepID=A0A251YJM6_9MICO|nr:AEC family transporter [Clavibacter michiganensis]OUE24414.1 putative transporter YfdV [Clavibacter michiganensis]